MTDTNSGHGPWELIEDDDGPALARQMPVPVVVDGVYLDTFQQQDDPLLRGFLLTNILIELVANDHADDATIAGLVRAAIDHGLLWPPGDSNPNNNWTRQPQPQRTATLRGGRSAPKEATT